MSVTNCTSSRLETGDDGKQQLASRLVYDAVGPWRKQLAYWHCLKNETWRQVGDATA